MADLEAQRDSSFYAYTTAPTHHLKSITASAVRFLDRNTSRTSPPAQPADVTLSCPPPCAGTGERNTVLDGLHFELDCYLHEPRMDHFKATTRGSEPGIIVVWCDPLLYWQVCISLHQYVSLNCLHRALKSGSHISSDLQWMSSRCKHLQSLASDSFPQARKHAPLAGIALIRISWKHFRSSNIHFVLVLLTSPGMWMTHSTLANKILHRGGNYPQIQRAYMQLIPEICKLLPCTYLLLIPD